ncbi:unnamed protein product [Symbiodinium sp. CCMP2592]|nr:unnamed protein product [Symbiodinium sp. CCMP2592]
MPRPAMKPSLDVAPPDTGVLPQEDVARGPRSLSPPRFFRAVDSDQQHKAESPWGSAFRQTLDGGMTATARLRLDEATRLFPEAHRPPHPRKQDACSGSSLRPRQALSDEHHPKRNMQRPQIGLGARNRGVLLEGPMASPSMLAGSAQPSTQTTLQHRGPCVVQGLHTADSGQVLVSRGNLHQAPAATPLQSRGCSHSSQSCPEPVTGLFSAAGASGGFARPLPVPVASKPLGKQLAAVHLGAIATQRSVSPLSPRGSSTSSAPLQYTRYVRTPVRARSISPAPVIHGANNASSLKWSMLPPSPTASPATSFRTTFSYIQPSAASVSSPVRGWEAARSLSPVVAYRSVLQPVPAPKYVLGAVMHRTSSMRAMPGPEFGCTQTTPAVISHWEAEAPSIGATRPTLCPEPSDHLGSGITRTVAAEQEELHEEHQDMDESARVQESNEEEEAYILSAFRHNHQSTDERHRGESAAAWRKAVADASFAAKAVLDMAPVTQQVADVEDSPPSMETLRATLQVLRARDDSAPPCTAKTVYGLDVDQKNILNDQSTAAALETAAMNLASAAAEAATALECRQ